MSFYIHRDEQFDNIIVRVSLKSASSSLDISNVGTSTSASSISISSVSGGISLSPASGKVVTILTGRALAVDTINQSGAATDLIISNTGSSTTATSVNINSTSGGLTFTAALNKDIAMVTSGTGALSLNGSPITASQVLKSSVTLQRADISALFATPFQLVAPVAGSRISVLMIVSNYYYNTTAVTNTAGASRIVYATNSTNAKTATATDFTSFGTVNSLGWDQTVNIVNNIRPIAANNNIIAATEVNDCGIYLAKLTNELQCLTGTSYVRMDTYYTVAAY